jgi:hypothetical protein
MCVFAGFQFAGQIVSFQLGFSVINVIDPQTQVESSVFSFLQNYLGLLFFLLINGHHWFLLAINQSFSLLPVGGAHIQAPLIEYLIRLSAELLINRRNCRPGDRRLCNCGRCDGSAWPGCSSNPHPDRRHAAQNPRRIWLSELFILFSSPLFGRDLLRAVQDLVFTRTRHSGVIHVRQQRQQIGKTYQKKAGKSAGEGADCTKQRGPIGRRVSADWWCLCFRARRSDPGK